MPASSAASAHAHARRPVAHTARPAVQVGSALCWCCDVAVCAVPPVEARARPVYQAPVANTDIIQSQMSKIVAVCGTVWVLTVQISMATCLAKWEATLTET